MRVSCDPETDSMTITLKDARISESDEVVPGVILDQAEDGSVVRFEILQASDRIDDTRVQVDQSA
jgi:uncharacterized protein YuzE